MESNKQYVIRKLKSPTINILGICNTLGLSRSTIYKLMADGDVRFSVVEALYVYFKNSAS